MHSLFNPTCSLNHVLFSLVSCSWRCINLITSHYTLMYTFLLTLGECASESYSSWVCVSVRAIKASMFAHSSRLWCLPLQMLGLKCVDFAKYVRVESYDDKCLLRRS